MSGVNKVTVDFGADINNELFLLLSCAVVHQITHRHRLEQVRLQFGLHLLSLTMAGGAIKTLHAIHVPNTDLEVGVLACLLC